MMTMPSFGLNAKHFASASWNIRDDRIDLVAARIPRHRIVNRQTSIRKRSIEASC